MKRFALISLLSFVAASPAWAADTRGDEDKTMDQDQDQDQDQDRDQDKLHDQDMEKLQTHLRKKVKLADDDIALMEPGLRRYFRLRGDEAPMRAMLEAGFAEGCQGECLREMVLSTNRAMVLGMQDNQAAQVVTECLQDRVQDRDRTGAKWNNEDFGDQLHVRVQERLQLWERDRDRLMEQERDSDMQRVHDREMERQRGRDQTRDGDGAGAGKRRGQ